ILCSLSRAARRFARPCRALLDFAWVPRTRRNWNLRVTAASLALGAANRSILRSLSRAARRFARPCRALLGFAWVPRARRNWNLRVTAASLALGAADGL